MCVLQPRDAATELTACVRCACLSVVMCVPALGTLCLQRFLKRYEAARGLSGRERVDRQQRQTEKDGQRRAAATTLSPAAMLGQALQTETGGEGRAAQRDVQAPSSPRAVIRNMIDPK